MIDLRKNWVQYNEQSFEALNLLVTKSRKTVEEDPISYAVFQALETSEMLLISEYSFEMAFNNKYKQ